MLPAPKILQSSINLQSPTPLSPQIQNIPASPPSPTIKHFCKFSRRELAIAGNSSLLLLLSSHVLEPLNQSKARAEENPPDATETDRQEEKSSTSLNASCSDKATTKKAFLDISVDGKPVGRIVIGLYGESTPAGAARFSSLVSGTAGITYRRKEFVKIMPTYVQHGGVRSYGVDAELAKRTGGNLGAETLTDEWERDNECSGIKNLAGTVSIIVRDPLKPPPKSKLVARNGKLAIDQEEVGTDPNGTEFVITTKDSPELDASNLVIGRVLEGMEVAEMIGQVKTVRDNTSSPYFRVAKLVGDKRAVVAERGFNRPYSKVVVTNCGLME
ncbi:peptidyl-prolyl cis-trans isomerase CYP26-2, chloroplastic [Mercurialis annua]|uniref:peptidyl-prolyl cis-trans isomerase CYP26-2, chloroplastic n=1 Tax=Mercurialis annua TaxID=3986 RepID=UPI00215FEAF0|nr:peptidyl-prolyl cis-trans isomerase CYP26-2, chloroplastic [Mercurialis annua]